MKMHVTPGMGGPPSASNGGDAQPSGTDDAAVAGVPGRHYHVERCRQMYRELPERVADYDREMHQLEESRTQKNAAQAEKMAGEGHFDAALATASKGQSRPVL